MGSTTLWPVLGVSKNERLLLTATVVLGEEVEMAMIEGCGLRSSSQDVAGCCCHVSLRYEALAREGCLTL